MDAKAREQSAVGFQCPLPVAKITYLNVIDGDMLVSGCNGVTRWCWRTMRLIFQDQWPWVI